MPKKRKTGTGPNRNNNAAFIFIGTITCVIILILTTRTSLMKSSLKPTPTPASDWIVTIPQSSYVSNIVTSKDGRTKTYQSRLGGYEIDYPNSLFLYESNETDLFWKIISGSICLTSVKKSGDYTNCNDGLQIFFSIPEIPGKGGMPCGTYETVVHLQDSDFITCMDQNKMNGGGIHFLQHPHRKTEIGINAVFNNGLTQKQAFAVLRTFRFID